MSIGLLGKKVGMTRVYNDKGEAIPVTAVLVEDNVASQVKKSKAQGGKDVCDSVQLAVGRKSLRQTAKPQLMHFKKAGAEPKAFIREFSLSQNEEVQLGQTFTVTLFSPGQMVDVIGQSKGKGFQGVIRKHGFSGQGDSHGSMMHRRNGAIGCRSTPGRVFKNMGMPGHMGDERVTVQNLQIIQVREADKLLLIKGALPGANGSYVVIRKAIKALDANRQKKYLPIKPQKVKK